MAGRERLAAVLAKRPADRLAWTSLVDQATLSALPEALRGLSPLDFYRHIGCDAFVLNVLGEDLIIFGCLDPTVFIAGPVEAIGPTLDTLITPRLRRPNFVLRAYPDRPKAR
jgi:hypothetical protein